MIPLPKTIHIVAQILFPARTDGEGRMKLDFLFRGKERCRIFARSFLRSSRIEERSLSPSFRGNREAHEREREALHSLVLRVVHDARAKPIRDHQSFFSPSRNFQEESKVRFKEWGKGISLPFRKGIEPLVRPVSRFARPFSKRTRKGDRNHRRKRCDSCARSEGRSAFAKELELGFRIEEDSEAEPTP